MKTAKEITEQYEDILQFDDKEQDVIIQAMKEYAEELIDEMIKYRDPRIYTGPEMKEKLKELVK